MNAPYERTTKQLLCPLCEETRIVFKNSVTIQCANCKAIFDDMDALEARPTTTAGEIAEFVADVERAYGVRDEGRTNHE